MTKIKSLATLLGETSIDVHLLMLRYRDVGVLVIFQEEGTEEEETEEEETEKYVGAYPSFG